MKFIFGFLTCLFFVSLAWNEVEAENYYFKKDWGKQYHDALEGVVRIETDTALGTGFFIKSDRNSNYYRVLSASHLFEKNKNTPVIDSSKVEIFTFYGESATAFATIEIKSKDFWLILVKKSDFKYNYREFELHDGEFKGDFSMAVGHNDYKEFYFKPSFGKCFNNGIYELTIIRTLSNKKFDSVMCTNKIVPGFSGGPLLTKELKVIGSVSLLEHDNNSIVGPSAKELKSCFDKTEKFEKQLLIIKERTGGKNNP